MTGAHSSYSEAVEWLYSLRWFGAKLGLQNTRRLAALAGNPQSKLRFIHVAGTNGKGSTCAMLEAIYRASGLRVGLFTSPHLVSFRERLQVNRHWISREDVVRLAAELRPLMAQFSAENHPTFFEAVTVMALLYFKEQQVDLVIWETGLGGRLDATNIVTPVATVITNVQLDHQKWLGETLAQIASEKAGIIKPGVPVISGASDPEAAAVVESVAAEQRAPLFKVKPWEELAPELGTLQLSLLGKHQFQNAATALTVAKVLGDRIAVTSESLRSALTQVHWPGRCQMITIPDGRRVLLDGAHNIAGAEALAETLRSFREPGTTFRDCNNPLLNSVGENVRSLSNPEVSSAQSGVRSIEPRDSDSRRALLCAPLILGMLQDKDWSAICRILAPIAKRILLVPVQNERTAQPEMLVEVCRAANPEAEIVCCQSLRDAWDRCGAEKFIAITGSLYLIGEAMQMLGLAPEEAEDERKLNEWNAAVTGLGRQEAGPTIRAVTFDVGGTLIEPWPSVGAIYAEVAARHGFRNLTPEQLNQGFRRAWKGCRAFDYSRCGWERLVNQTFGCAAEERLPFFDELYERFTEPKAWKIFEDVEPTLDRLASAGLRLAVLSNWDDRLRGLLERLNLARYFELQVISCEVGFPKPSPVIFQHAAGKLGLPAGTILHVGDSAELDVEGAREAGFAALLLKRTAPPPAPPGTIRSLTELMEMTGV